MATEEISPATRLVTYFNDHLAGSVAAVSLIEDLGHTDLPEFRSFLDLLKSEVTNDQFILRNVILFLHGKESPIKAGTAWVAEKIANLKLRLADPAENGLGTTEALEVLSLGIEGKRLMWLLLADLSLSLPTMPRSELDRLAREAQRQREGVERWRIYWAARAFVDRPAHHV